MPCSSCGQRRQTVTPAQAEAIVSQSKPIPEYVITAPDGSTETFTDYLEAVTHRRQVNGTLTTSTRYPS